MEYLLFFFLIFATVFAFYAGEKKILSPWFLLCLLVTGSFSLALFNSENWLLDINGIFVSYVMVAVLSFGIGTYLLKLVRPYKAIEREERAYLPKKPYKVKYDYPVWTVCAFAVVLSALYIAKLFLDNPFTGSLTGTIRHIYDRVVEDGYTPGTIYTQFREIVTALAYISTYRIMVLCFRKEGKNKLVGLIIPIVAFLLVVLVASDRNVLLRYAFFTLVIFVFFFTKTYRGKNANTVLTLVMGGALLFIVLVFFLFGKMKEYKSDIFRMIGIYAGSGLYNFNLWSKTFSGPYLFGGATFHQLISTINAVIPFANIPTVDIARFDEYIIFNGLNDYVYSSNIYSAMFPFARDFGVFGVCLFPMLMGMFYEWLFRRSSRPFGLNWILYGALVYPVLFFPILEQLFARLHLGLLYEVFWLVVLYWLLMHDKTKERNYARKIYKKIRGGA